MKLYGIYHANGGLLGKLTYIAGKLMGQSQCALCDITHDMVREKEAFKNCAKQLPLPITNVHLNEQPTSLKAFTIGKSPCVVLEKEGLFLMALNREQLENCKGDVTAFEQRLKAFLKEHL